MRTIGSALHSSLSCGKNYDNFLAIRVVAASLVIYGHSYALAAKDGTVDLVTHFLGYRYSGDLAVAVFFVLSGFLVCGSYDRFRDPWLFIRARAVRLLPGLAACLLLSTLVLGLTISSLPGRDYFASEQTWRYFFTNLSLVGNEWILPGVFLHNRYGTAANGSLWTLPIEARLYLMVALAGVCGLLARRHIALFLIVAGGIWLIAHPNSIASLGGTEAARVMMFFAAGTLVYLYSDKLVLDWRFMLGLCCITWLFRHSHYYEFVFSISLVYGVFWLAYLPRMPFPRLANDISYGTYLFGWPVQQILAQLNPMLTPINMTLVALPIAWCLAMLSWHFIESPSLMYFKVGSTRRTAAGHSLSKA